MNSIKPFPLVVDIGSYGKLFITIFAIILLIPIGKKIDIHIEDFNTSYLIALSSLIIFFTLFYSVNHFNVNSLIINMAFPLYFLFYFLLTKNWIYLNSNKEGEGSNFKDMTIREILIVFKWTFAINLVFWMSIVLISDIDMSDSLNHFGGFMQSKIVFGLFASTGFFVSFYLRNMCYKPDKSVLNLVLLLIYAVLCWFTSRNAFLSILIVLVYYYISNVIRNGILVFSVLIIVLFGIEYYDDLGDNSYDYINSLTTGRFEIWRLVLNQIFNENILIGKGLFNLNPEILADNQGQGFYYLDKIDFLYFHSSYFEFLAAGGLITLILFIIYIRRSWKNLKRLDQSICVGLLFGGIFESYLTQPFMIPSILFYVIIISSNFHISQNQNGNTISKLNI